MLQWSNKQLNFWFVVGKIVQVLLLLVAPIVTVIIKFGIQEKVTMSFFGICIIILFVGLFVVFGKKEIDKMKMSSKKNICQMVYKLAFVIVAVYGLYKLRTDLHNALWTMTICLIYVTLSIILEGLFFKRIEEVYYYNGLAKDDINMKKRIGLM